MRPTILAARLALATLLVTGGGFLGSRALAQSTPASKLFSAEVTPAAMRPQTIGFYTRGCLAGAETLATDGQYWQAMRLSRNRRYGHPELVALLERLAREAAEFDGWPGLLIGDMSQPRGGPMPSGHASHQVGLDADIWLTPMPNRRLTYQEREDKPFVSLLKKGSNYVDEARWDPVYRRLLKRAAGFKDVQRMFVHPGIKKKLCETAGPADRGWMNKIRANWGHDSHFHIRLFCQPGSPDCEPQPSTGVDDGCGKQLDWWFDVALKPAPPSAKPAKPAKPKPQMTMSALPKACRAVLSAPSVGVAVAGQTPFSQPSAAAALAPEPRGEFPPLPLADIPLPMERPLN